MNQAIILNRTTYSFNKLHLSVFAIYLFHVSAVVGVSLGFEEWFIPKTPLNLTIMLALLMWIFPLDSKRKLIAGALFFTAGMVVEWLGANFGLLFGSYHYGANLGVKIGGVPLLIGINWAILVLITGEIANSFQIPKWVKVFIGAALMVLLDYFMEVAAPAFDFWRFEGGEAPLSNYIAWFGIACILHGIFQWMKIKGNFKFSLHVYICQFLFFAFFYVYFGL